MTNCTQCDAPLAPDTAVCGTCGAAVAAPVADASTRPAGGAPAGATPAFGGALNDWQANVTRPSMSGATSVIGELKTSGAGGRPVPQLAMVLAGVAAATGLLILIRALKALLDIFDLGSLGGGLGGGLTFALVLQVAAVGLGLAALWVAIAWLARGGSPITIPLIYVAGAATGISGLSGGSVGSGLLRGSGLSVLGALLAFGAIGLTFVPEVRAFLYGGVAPARPVSLVASEALLYWFAVTGILVGVSYLLLGATISTYGVRGTGTYYIAALAYVAAAVAALVFAKAVGRGATQARLLISATAAGFVVLMLVAGALSGAWLHTGILVGVVALLWLAADARAAFGDSVLDVNRSQGQGGSSAGQ